MIVKHINLFSGIDNKQIHFKHSWTEEELTTAINNILARARISLSGASGTPKSIRKNRNKNNVPNFEQNIDNELAKIFGNLTNKTNTVLTRILQNAEDETGWDANELLGKINKLPGRK